MTLLRVFCYECKDKIFSRTFLPTTDSCSLFFLDVCISNMWPLQLSMNVQLHFVFEQFIWLQATVLISQELPGLCSWELLFQIQRSCVHTNTTQLGKYMHWYSWLCASFLNGLCSVQLNLSSGLKFWISVEHICITVTCLNTWWKKSVLTCFIENKSVCSFTLQYNLFGFK